MIIYKIILNEDFRFVGSTMSSIKRKRFAHKICAKNILTCCSLYKKIRELDIEPTSINLEVLEIVKDDNIVNRLAFWKKEEKSNLDECRARMYTDSNAVIKKTNMGCECNNIPLKIGPGKLFGVTFD